MYLRALSINLALEQWSEAQEWVEKGLAINVQYMRLYGCLAEALYELGRLEEARIACNKAMFKNKDDAELQLLKSKILLKQEAAK